MSPSRVSAVTPTARFRRQPALAHQTERPHAQQDDAGRFGNRRGSGTGGLPASADSIPTIVGPSTLADKPPAELGAWAESAVGCVLGLFLQCHGHLLQQHVDDVVRRDVFTVGMKRGDDAVTEHGVRD